MSTFSQIVLFESQDACHNEGLLKVFAEVSISVTGIYMALMWW
jgi:hypothetical protein